METPQDIFESEYDSFGNKISSGVSLNSGTNSLSGVFNTNATDPTSAGSIMDSSNSADIKQTSGAYFAGKTSFTDTTAGWRLGIDTDANQTPKFSIGDATNYLTWDGTSLTVSSVINGGSLNIGNGNAVIDSSGNATFKGLTSLSVKTYTDFEYGGRFSDDRNGTGSNTFSSNGLHLETGTTANSYAVDFWFISPLVFKGSPTFSCVIDCANLTAASGSAVAYAGLGNPDFHPGGVTFNTMSCCGFMLQKALGVITLYAIQAAGVNQTQSSALTTVVDGDVLDLILKKHADTSIDYYWRKNVGTLSSVTTLSTNVPLESTVNNYTEFGVSNISTAFGFTLNFISASYER